MSDFQQAIEDARADLDAAEEVLALRRDELEIARRNLEEAHRVQFRLQKQHLELLRSQIKGEPA